MKLAYRLIAIIFFASVFHDVTLAQSFENWIAYPIGTSCPDTIGLLHPETLEEKQLNVGCLDPESLRWSPDYTQLLYMRPAGVFSVDIQSGGMKQILEIEDENIAYPIWSPDGLYIVFIKIGAPHKIVVIATDGNQRISIPDVQAGQIYFTDDGSEVIFQRNENGEIRLYGLNLLNGEVGEIDIINTPVENQDMIFDLRSSNINESDLIVLDMKTREANRIIHRNTFDWSPHFVLDKNYVLFFQLNENDSGLRLLNLEDETIEVIETGILMGFDVSPSGESLVYLTRLETSTQLCILNLIANERRCPAGNVYTHGYPVWR